MNVFITGASRGIGRALAFRFGKAGHNCVLGARSEEDLKRLSKEIEEKYSVKAIPIRTDIRKPEDCRRFLERGVKSLGSVDVLINNAGIGLYASIEDTEPEDLREIFEVNFFGFFYCAKLAIPYLKESKGTLINISSVSGKVPIPFMGGYCASKYAMNALSDSLRAELRPYGVHVLLVCPGAIETGFAENALGNVRPPEMPGASSPEKLADAIFKALKRRKREIIHPSWNRFAVTLQRMSPGVFEKATYRVWTKSMRDKKEK